MSRCISLSGSEVFLRIVTDSVHKICRRVFPICLWDYSIKEGDVRYGVALMEEDVFPFHGLSNDSRTT